MEFLLFVSFGLNIVLLLLWIDQFLLVRGLKGDLVSYRSRTFAAADKAHSSVRIHYDAVVASLDAILVKHFGSLEDR